MSQLDAIQNLESEIKEVMAEILDIDEDVITDDFGPESTDTWDSLNNLKMITALEETFDIALTMDEINSMVNFEKIKTVISAKRA